MQWTIPLSHGAGYLLGWINEPNRGIFVPSLSGASSTQKNHQIPFLYPSEPLATTYVDIVQNFYHYLVR